MRADELGARALRRVHDHKPKPEPRTAFKHLPLQLPNANPAVGVRPPEMFRELKQREPCVVARGPFEFGEPL